MLFGILQLINEMNHIVPENSIELNQFVCWKIPEMNRIVPEQMLCCVPEHTIELNQLVLEQMLCCVPEHTIELNHIVSRNTPFNSQ